MKRTIALLLLTAFAVLAHAEVRPFESGSLAKIRAARDGRPFILSFWSLECAHCPKELKALGELKRQHPALDVVLVSTDTPAESSALAEFAAQSGLARAEQWVFAGDAQKLRYEIDRRWWGELPRTYFHDSAHRVEAKSGVVSAEALADWAREQQR